MMTIGSAAGAGNGMWAGMGNNMQTDSVSKNIQRQIENAQKKLQEISSNQDMPLEEKMKKRQEIQQEITNLNQELRQHQVEMRKEQQSKRTTMDDMLGGSKQANSAKADGAELGLSQAGMQAMISADASMKQAQVQGSVATQMNGKAGILESEIKMDKARGENVEKKEEELAKIKENEQEAISSQVSTLASANQEMEEAKEAEETGKTARTDEDNEEEKIGQDIGSAHLSTETPDAAELETLQPVNRVSVDIRL